MNARLINGQTPFLCGGWDNAANKTSNECYHLTERGSWMKDETAVLDEARANANFGSVVLNENQLVLSGGYTGAEYSGGQYLQSIEVMTPHTKAKTLSVKLPKPLRFHCAVKWDTDTIMVIGGQQSYDGSDDLRHDSSECYFINIKTNKLINYLCQLD